MPVEVPGLSIGILEAAENTRHIVECVNCHDDLLAALKVGYTYALMTDGLVRIRNQAALCAMRDAIASATGEDAETVQNELESLAYTTKATQL